MKKIYQIMFLLASVMTLATACDDDVNKWPVDMDHDRLFRPLTFESRTIEATAIEISYSKIVNANTYIFEFSEDSLEFNQIVRADVILADTLQAFAEDQNQTRTTYRTWFQNLKGVTKYSVRMKGISRLGIESGWVSFFFSTPEEQIFTRITAEIDKAMLCWTPVEEMTDFILYERNIDGEILNETAQTINLQANGIDPMSGEYLLEGLKTGTPYLIRAMNGDNKRGEMTFRTSGIPNSNALNITPDMSINQELRRVAAEGVTNLTLIFEGGQTYNYINIKEDESDPDGIRIPIGIENLAFAGVASATGEMPLLRLAAVNLSEEMESVSFDNLAMDGEGSNYMFSFGDKYFKAISFTNCIISNYARSVVRATAAVKVNTVIFDNCMTNSIATNGYAMIVANPAELGEVSITNCTMTEMGTLIDQRGGVDKFLLDKCTIYNNEFGTSNFFRMQTEPAEHAITNIIIAGPNKNVELGNGYGNYRYLDFSTCYLTSEVRTNSSRPLTNVNTYNGTAEDLFTDPVNGDFHIKPGAQFAAEGVAGDPRWNN